jgi:hypothetical protein
MLSRMTLMRAGVYSAGGGLALLVLGMVAAGNFGPCGPSNEWTLVPLFVGIASIPIGLVLMRVSGLAKLLTSRSQT